MQTLFFTLKIEGTVTFQRWGELLNKLSECEGNLRVRVTSEDFMLSDSLSIVSGYCLGTADDMRNRVLNVFTELTVKTYQTLEVSDDKVAYIQQKILGMQ